MTREEAFKEINRTQDDYVDQLIQYMNDPATAALKEINFTSPTGTGKTNMMAKLMNRLSDCYFIVTTLSKGQLKAQVQDSFHENCLYDNYTVYGSQDFKVNSILTGQDILSGIPEGKECIWLRDEGHIHTNNYMGLLEARCDKIINISATNQQQTGITCNFTHTMMLRTVNQQTGKPEDAIQKLLEIKAQHSMVKDYNPCAIFRLIKGDDDLYMRVIRLCEQHNLKYINISDDDYVMAELCKDDNPYDVIINKFKLVEGIDIRRAHVLYMDSQPDNDVTTIQVIGRCRRNALLYRNDIDILAPENKQLLKNTRECYVFYNVEKMKISTDETGELCYAFCPYISCERLKLGATIEVENGQMPNGLYVYELMGQTGKFLVEKDEATGFNVVNPNSDFYKAEIRNYYPQKYVYCSSSSHITKYVKILVCDLKNIFVKEDKEKSYLNINQTIVYKYVNLFKIIDHDEYSKNNYHRFFDRINNTDIQPYGNSSHVYITYDVFQYKKISIIDLYTIFKENKFVNIYDIQRDPKYRDNFIQINKSGINEHIYPDINNLIALNEIEHNDNYIYCLDNTTRQYGKILVSDCINLYKRENLSYGINIQQYQNDPEYKNLFKHVSQEEYEANHIDYCCNYLFINSISDTVLQTQKNTYTSQQYIYYSYNLYIYKKIAAKDLYNIVINDDSFDYIDINYIKDNDRYKKYFQIVDEEEYKLSNNRSSYYSKLELNQLLQASQKNAYHYIYNNNLIATIGTDNFKVVKNEKKEALWIEDRTITSNIKSYTKLNRFITEKYKNELSSIQSYLFTGKNHFELNKKCNSMLGYCVEYYSKYKIYGKDYLGDYINVALHEGQSQSASSKLQIARYNIIDKVQLLTETSAEIIIRACLLKYKNEIALYYGNQASTKIMTASVFTLLQTNYEDFIRLVIALGTKTAQFVKETLYSDKEAQNNVLPGLQTKHIVGLADYITEDTILDIKVTNTIDETYIKQVLAYHYLSTMRSDLHIKRVIVYDATSGRSITINITPENLTPQSTLTIFKEVEAQKEQEKLQKQEELQKKIEQQKQEELQRHKKALQQQRYEQERKKALEKKEMTFEKTESVKNQAIRNELIELDTKLANEQNERKKQTLKNQKRKILQPYIIRISRHGYNYKTMTDEQILQLGESLGII